MNHITRRLVSLSFVVAVIGVALIMWFYIDIQYADQAFGLNNVAPNPTLRAILCTLDAAITLGISVMLLYWGWIARPAKPAKPVRKSARKRTKH